MSFRLNICIRAAGARIILPLGNLRCEAILLLPLLTINIGVYNGLTQVVEAFAAAYSLVRAPFGFGLFESLFLPFFFHIALGTNSFNHIILQVASPINQWGNAFICLISLHKILPFIAVIRCLSLFTVRALSLTTAIFVIFITV